jgi:hypothetical protein
LKNLALVSHDENRVLWSAPGSPSGAGVEVERCIATTLAAVATVTAVATIAAFAAVPAAVAAITAIATARAALATLASGLAPYFVGG